MTAKQYLKLPWSMEDTIENLKELKESLQERCIIINLHGRGEKDAEEVAFDFDRAIEALEKQIPKKPLKAYDEQVEQHWLSCPMCYKGLCWEHGFKPKHCSECGQAILWEGNE